MSHLPAIRPAQALYDPQWFENVRRSVGFPEVPSFVTPGLQRLYLATVSIAGAQLYTRSLVDCRVDPAEVAKAAHEIQNAVVFAEAIRDPEGRTPLALLNFMWAAYRRRNGRGLLTVNGKCYATPLNAAVDQAKQFNRHLAMPMFGTNWFQRDWLGDLRCWYDGSSRSVDEFRRVTANLPTDVSPITEEAFVDVAEASVDPKKQEPPLQEISIKLDGIAQAVGKIDGRLESLSRAPSIVPNITSIDDEEEAILRHLYRSLPRRQKHEHIIGHFSGRVGEKTIRQRMASLARKGLVDYPEGERQGAVISIYGKQLVEKLNSDSRLSAG